MILAWTVVVLLRWQAQNLVKKVISSYLTLKVKVNHHENLQDPLAMFFASFEPNMKILAQTVAKLSHGQIRNTLKSHFWVNSTLKVKVNHLQNQ